MTKVRCLKTLFVDPQARACPALARREQASVNAKLKAKAMIMRHSPVSNSAQIAARSQRNDSQRNDSQRKSSQRKSSQRNGLQLFRCNCSIARMLPHHRFDQQMSNQCFGKSIALPKVKQLFFSLKRRKSSSRLRSNCQDRATVALRSSQRPETSLRSASWKRNSLRQREATTAPPFTSKVVFGQPATLRLV